MRQSALFLVLFISSQANALLLYDNGPVTRSSYSALCDQGPTGCGGSGTWTVFDNFVVQTDAVLSDFDYTDYFYDGGPANYVQTNWSLFMSDPFTSSPIASGSVVATLTETGPGARYRFDVSGLEGLDIVLSAGIEYWLGINNTVTGGILTTIAGVDDPGGMLNFTKQSDGAGVFKTYLFDKNRAFRIYGTAVPEPTTALLLWLGLASLSLVRRTSSTI